MRYWSNGFGDYFPTQGVILFRYRKYNYTSKATARDILPAKHDLRQHKTAGILGTLLDEITSLKSNAIGQTSAILREVFYLIEMEQTAIIENFTCTHHTLAFYFAAKLIVTYAIIPHRLNFYNNFSQCHKLAQLIINFVAEYKTKKLWQEIFTKDMCGY
jgi:hypothetical protein